MIVGTAGHIDHGKTTLVRALTGVDTDRLPEEKRRGISIELGYAYLDLPDPPGGRIGFIDVPGHERLVHTMVAGATGIDFADARAPGGPVAARRRPRRAGDHQGRPGAGGARRRGARGSAGAASACRSMRVGASPTIVSIWRGGPASASLAPMVTMASESGSRSTS